MKANNDNGSSENQDIKDRRQRKKKDFKISMKHFEVAIQKIKKKTAASTTTTNNPHLV